MPTDIYVCIKLCIIWTHKYLKISCLSKIQFELCILYFTKKSKYSEKQNKDMIRVPRFSLYSMQHQEMASRFDRARN